MPETQSSPALPDIAILQARIKAELGSVFAQSCILAELEGRLLRDWQLQQKSGRDPEAWLKAHLARVIEEYFAELRTHCVAYLRHLLKHPERAEDIAQEALLSLIREPGQVQMVQPWLRKVCYNLLVDQFRQDQAQREFLNILQVESELLRDLVSLPQELQDSGEIGVLLPEMLSHPDFLALQEIRKYQGLRAWAGARGLTYEQARQRSKAYKRNLKAACLRKLGWVMGSDVLDYQDYKSIQRYVRSFLQAGLDAARGLTPRGRFTVFKEDLSHGFQDFAKFLEWDVRDLGESRYRLHIVLLNTSQAPVVFTAGIRIKANRRIETEKVRFLPPVRKLDLPPGYRLPVEKGLVLLSRKQIEDLIKRSN